MMTINLLEYENLTIRFLNRKTQKPIIVKDIVSILDKETGSYTGIIVDENGNTTEVRGSMGCAVDIHIVGEGY